MMGWEGESRDRNNRSRRDRDGVEMVNSNGNSNGDESGGKDRGSLDAIFLSTFRSFSQACLLIVQE